MTITKQKQKKKKKKKKKAQTFSWGHSWLKVVKLCGSTTLTVMLNESSKATTSMESKQHKSAYMKFKYPCMKKEPKNWKKEKWSVSYRP